MGLLRLNSTPGSRESRGSVRFPDLQNLSRNWVKTARFPMGGSLLERCKVTSGAVGAVRKHAPWDLLQKPGPGLSRSFRLSINSKKILDNRSFAATV